MRCLVYLKVQRLFGHQKLENIENFLTTLLEIQSGSDPLTFAFFRSCGLKLIWNPPYFYKKNAKAITYAFSLNRRGLFSDCLH